MTIEELEKSYREGSNALSELIAVMAEMAKIIKASNVVMSSDKASEADKLVAYGAKNAMRRLFKVMKSYEEID